MILWRELYKKYVPSQTREYIESRESSRGASPSQVWQTRPHD